MTSPIRSMVVVIRVDRAMMSAFTSTARSTNFQGRDVAAEVVHLEAGNLQHDADKVLADIVGIALDDADHDFPGVPCELLLDVRAQNVEPGIHGVRGDQKFGDEIFLFVEQLAGTVDAQNEPLLHCFPGVVSPLENFLG